MHLQINIGRLTPIPITLDFLDHTEHTYLSIVFICIYRLSLSYCLFEALVSGLYFLRIVLLMIKPII